MKYGRSLFSGVLAFVPADAGLVIWVVPFFMLYLAGLTEKQGQMVLVYAGFLTCFIWAIICSFM